MLTYYSQSMARLHISSANIIINTTLMIRNSTEKYRNKYQQSLPKNPASTVSSYQDQHLPTHRTVSYFPNNTEHLHTQDSSLSMPEKWSEFKLKKKNVIKGTSKIESPSRSRLKYSRQTDQEESRAPLKRDPQNFIQNIPKNSVFFCCKCFQYVFEIEKKRHYPDCKDVINPNELRSQQFQEMADRRIKNIIELSRYSGVRIVEMEYLYKLYEVGSLNRIEKVPFDSVSFFTLGQIDQAFHYTFQELLKGVSYHQNGGVFNCF